jgi:hypothetical protein
VSNTKELFPLPNQPSIIHNYSRFNYHSVYQDPVTGDKFIGAWKPPNIPFKNSDKSMQVTQETAYRPDIISYNYYATPLLAWLLCYVNSIPNPYDKVNGLYPGRVIRIPDITTITAALTF